MTRVVENGSRPVRCLSVGHITHDRYGDTLAVGGSALYAAKTWQGLGAEAGMATSLGRDFAFYDALDGVTLSATSSPHTTTFENTYPPGQPRLMLVEEVAHPVTPAQLTNGWQRPDVVFLCPVIGEVPLGEWVDAVPGGIVGIGLQGFLKQSGPVYDASRGNHVLEKKRFVPSDEMLSSLSAVFLSQEDIDGYADAGLLPRLRRQVPLVALTRGEAGAVIYSKERVFKVGVFPTHATDPTGAGDTFAAATLLGLAQGETAEEAVRLGAAAASVVVESKGSNALERVHLAIERRSRIPVSPSGK